MPPSTSRRTSSPTVDPPVERKGRAEPSAAHHHPLGQDVGVSDAQLPWPGSWYPLGATADDEGDELRAVGRRGSCRRGVPARRRRRDPLPADRAHLPRLARLPARRAVRGSATASASTGRGTRARARASTRRSCCSTRTPGRSTASCATTPAVYGHDAASDDSVRDDTDSAPLRPALAWSSATPSTGAGRPPPATPWADTVIYELHVRGFTRQHPGVPEELRGTYAGLAHPAAIEHLRRPRRHGRRAAAGPPLRQRAARWSRAG